MTRIALIALPECIRSSVVGSLEVFEMAGGLLAQKAVAAGDESGQRSGIDVQLVSAGARTVRMDRVSVGPCLPFAKVGEVDLIVINALAGDPGEHLDKYRDLTGWIRDRYDEGHCEVASICTGAFLLAATGLVDGRACSTHWAAAERFAGLFPKVELVADTIITDENRIYTSGGATSFYNLLIHIIEKHHGRELALRIAKGFLIDLDRVSQTHFSIFSPQKQHQDLPIKTAQAFIEDNYAEALTVDEISRRVGMSRRSFIRRFKIATRNTPIQYIQRVKIEAAKKALEASSATVSEVMYGVGYNDPKYFRRLFREATGLTPVAYRGKYNHGQR